MRVRVMLVSFGLIVGSAAIGSAPPSVAGSKPLRSGTIEGGIGFGYEDEGSVDGSSGCQEAVDCRAWLQSGCNPALTGHDPVLTASIVDVGGLADGRTRRTFQSEAPYVPPWGLWPGAVIQFWRSNCTEIHNAKLHTLGSNSAGRCEFTGHTDVRCEALRIPRGARWMTVSGYVTTVHLAWTLTN